MTKDEKKEIAILRVQGLGYKKIASKLDIPLSTVKSHCLRHNLPTGDGDLCIQCGMPLIKKNKGAHKKFCNSKCRNNYWNNHPSGEGICICCGRNFKTRKYDSQKYCSHECYIKYRFNQ